MNILVLTQQYPKNKDLYRNMFVHTRLKSYRKIDSSINFTVFVLNNKNNKYNFEDISVIEGDSKYLKEVLQRNSYEKIIIHFLTFYMVPVLLNVAQGVPKLIWVHGYEALNWRSRLFNVRSIKFIKYIIGNVIQIRYFRKYMRLEKNSKFIFVSKWMKRSAEKDIKITFKDAYILPNGIDTNKFPYKQKSNELRNKILVIRPFNSRKYATDIVAKTILELSKFPEFKKFEFTIVGQGKFFKEDTNKIVKFSNVKLINRFLTSAEIKKLHDQNGVFLCPTRQDAQGVSMCEAMSSGLVPITSNNTAIPEFVKNSETGFLTNKIDDIVATLLLLEKNADIFQKNSVNASNFIKSYCNLSTITLKELDLILKK